MTFLLRSKCLNFMAAITICSDFGVQKIKSATVSIVSPFISYEVMGPEAMILVFWMLSFKPTFSLSSFTFIKRLFFFAYCCKGFVICISEVIFLSAILIPACALSSPAYLMMYSACKLNKQGDNIQPWCTPFLIWNQSVILFSSKCCFLTFIQISQEACEVIWYSHLSEFSTVCCDPHSQSLWHSQ